MELFKLFGTIAVQNTDANNAIDETTGKAEKSESKMSSAFKKIGTAVATYFAVSKITEFGKECINMASDVEEMQNKFNVVFQGMTDEVSNWADEYAKSIGRNSNTIKTYLADNQNMFVGMGMTRDEGAKLSEQMVSLALDLASFNNLQETDAVNAFSKAIMGETESAKSLGAVLNDNTRAMAMEKLGYNGKFDALTEAQKMEVNYQAILMQSTDAVGDCERSVDSYKGRQIQLQSALENTKEKIGALLLPLATFGTKLITNGVNKIQKFIDIMSDADKRTEFFRNALRNVFSDEFIIAMQEWIEYLSDIIQIFASNAIEEFKAKIEPLKEMFSALISVLQPLVETILSTLVMRFDDLITYWNNVLMPCISFVIDVFTQFVTTIADAVAPAIRNICDKFVELQQYISGAVQNFIIPMIQSFIEMIRQLWEENQDKITMIGNLFATIFNSIANVISWFVGIVRDYIYPVLKWLCDTVSSHMGVVKSIFQSAFDFVGGLIQNVTRAFQGFANFIGGIFSGDIKGAFRGIVDFIGGIFGGIIGIVKAPINAVIDIFNGFIGGLNKLKIPDWVPLIGGQGVNIPLIPKLEKGGVLEKGQTGFLEGNGAEAVVPLEKNRQWISRVSEEMNVQGIGGSDKETLSLLQQILAVLADIKEGNDDLPDNLLDSMANGLRFNVNGREFARMVKAVN